MTAVEENDWALHAQGRPGIEDQFPKAVEAIIHSIQTYKAHNHQRSTRFKQGRERPVLFQEGNQSEAQQSSSSSDLSDDEGDLQINDTLFGHR